MKTILSRRALLRGGASGVTVTLALPALEAMFDGNGLVHAADGTPPPKRLGVFYWGNGMRPEEWVPAQQGATWTSTALAPLQPVQRYVSVLTGLECKSRGTAHHVGRAAVLSGSYDRAAGAFGSATLPSVDRLVSDAWRGRTPFDSVHVGISMRRKGGIDARPANSSSSWDGSFHFAQADYSPAQLYQRLFQNVRGAGPEDPARAKELLARRSAIDLVTADARALQSRLGQSDRQRIEQHLQGLRDLERGLSISAGASCQPRPQGADPKVDLGHEDLDARNRAIADILAVALACDLTRVVVITYSVMQADTIFWQVGATEGCHVVTHDDRNLPAAQTKPPQKELHGRIVRYTMGHLAELLGRLMATPEGAGNLLDSAAIVATSEIGDGTAHALTEFPLLLAGRAGGALKSGLHYRSTSQESTSKAVLTALRALDPARFPSFGKDVGFADQPITALLA